MTLSRVLLAFDAFIVSMTTAWVVVSVVQRDALGSAAAGIVLGIWLMVSARDLGKYLRERA